MDLLNAINTRHSVRSYTEKSIEGDTLSKLHEQITICNKESGLNIQLCLNDSAAFSGFMARYGKFSGVKNYIALVGQKGSELEEKCGYQGQKLALYAQQLGLNTCWVAASYSKGKSIAKVDKGQKLLMVLTIGYGTSQGVPHKSKPLDALYNVTGTVPDWFLKGMEAVQLAPTAMNQQKFVFSLFNNQVSANPGSGFYTKTDLGIAKCHFEIGAGEGDWKWA